MRAPQSIVILGGAGIGMIAASIIEETPHARVAGFLSDSEPVGAWIGRFRSYPVLGASGDVADHLAADSGLAAFVAWVGYREERAAYARLCELAIPPDRTCSLYHSTAVVPLGHCEVGRGVLVGPHAQMSPDTSVGDHCMLLGGSFLGHDSTMAPFSRLATNATVGARVRIGTGVHVGSNATIREDVTIGDFAFVGAGAVVLEDVPEGVVVVGNPARTLRASK